MVYKEIFDMAAKRLGIKVIYYETGEYGHATARTIQNMIPDFRQRTFYISGSHHMVDAFEDILGKLNLPKRQIKIDYFPGF